MAQGDVIDVTLSLDTSAYASGDVLAEVQEVKGFFKDINGNRALHSVIAVDEEDQNVAFDLVFFNDSSASLGTENAAVSISDADAGKIVGYVKMETTDSNDLDGSRLFAKGSIGQVLRANGESASIWIGAITRGGTPTYTASGIKLKLGVL